MLTYDTDINTKEVKSIAKTLRAEARKLGKVKVLTANMYDKTARVAHIGIRHIGVVCNLDTTIPSDVDTVASLSKILTLRDRKNKKILVPVYPKLEITYTKLDGTSVMFESENIEHNVIWYGAEMLLNGAEEHTTETQLKKARRV